LTKEEDERTAFEIWCCFYFARAVFGKLVQEYPSPGLLGGAKDKLRVLENDAALAKNAKRAISIRRIPFISLEIGRREAAVLSDKSYQELRETALRSPCLDEMATWEVIVALVMDS